VNRLPVTTNLGTLGELYVQIRLLEHGIQAAQPLKDSGNDLIAVYENQFRAIQVRSTTSQLVDKPAPEKSYHILAIVSFQKADHPTIDGANLYLFTKAEVTNIGVNLAQYSNSLISEHRVQTLFKQTLG
jgi:hypothetical protein